MPGHLRQGGAWQAIGNMSLRVGGAWAQVQRAWVRQGGAWVQFFTYLTPPTGLSAVDVSWCEDLITPHYEIQVHWTPSDSGKSTIIYRDGSPIDSVGPGVDTYVDTGLSEGTAYDYQVSTFDSASGSESDLTAVYVGTTISNVCGI